MAAALAVATTATAVRTAERAAERGYYHAIHLPIGGLVFKMLNDT
jgi:hypothetical protein